MGEYKDDTKMENTVNITIYIYYIYLGRKASSIVATSLVVKQNGICMCFNVYAYHNLICVTLSSYAMVI
jgi:hypothetical protein